MALFAKNDLPNGASKPEAVDKLNAIFEKLQGRQLDRIEMHDLHKSGRVSKMTLSLSQGYIRRCVELAEASAILCKQSHWLSAITVARSLLETIAAYNEVVRKLRNLISGGDIDNIFEFISAAGFATRLPHLIEATGEPAVKAPNVLSQIDKLKKTDGDSAREDYDYLSEFTHPNSIGTLLFFGRFDKKNGTMHFCSQGWDRESVGIWVAWVCSMLLVTVENDKTIEKLAGQISVLDDREN